VFEFAELLIGGGRERRRAEGGEEGVGGRRVKTARQRQRQRQRRGEGNESEMEKRQKAIGGPSRIWKEREGEEPRACGPTWQREKTKAERDLPLTAAAALLRCLCQECGDGDALRAKRKLLPPSIYPSAIMNFEKFI
jgi:hypothetical protein